MNGNTRPVRTNIGDGTVIEAVIEAVAEANGVDPMELDTLLHDVVDPDALVRLFPADAGPDVGHVSFTMAGCEVVVESSGRVTATPLAGAEGRVATD